MTASGQGWSAATLDELGDGPGFRKVRSALGIKAFGVNAIVLPAGMETGFHWHDEQDELYFVHAGRILMELDQGETHELGPGGFIHVEAATRRKIRNVGDGDAVYVVIGGKGGYVGRDGRAPEDSQRVQTSS